MFVKVDFTTAEGNKNIQIQRRTGEKFMRSEK